MGQANIAQACVNRDRDNDPILHELLKLRVENARLALQVRQSKSSMSGRQRQAMNSPEVSELRDRLAQAEVDGELLRVHLAVAQERLQMAEAQASSSAANGSSADARPDSSAEALERLRKEFQEVTSHADGLDGALAAARAEHKALQEAYSQIEGALSHARTELSSEQDKHQALELAASRADMLQSELMASQAEGKQMAVRTADLGDALALARSEEAVLRKAKENSEAAVQRAWFLAAAERDGREAENAIAQALQTELAQAQAELLSEQNACEIQKARANDLQAKLTTVNTEHAANCKYLSEQSGQICLLNMEMHHVHAALLAESRACKEEAECVAELTSKLQSLQEGVHQDPVVEPAPVAKALDYPLSSRSTDTESQKETPRTFNNRMLTRPRGGRGGRS